MMSPVLRMGPARAGPAVASLRGASARDRRRRQGLGGRAAHQAPAGAQPTCRRLMAYPTPTLCKAAHRRARARQPSRPAPRGASARRPSPPAPGRESNGSGLGFGQCGACSGAGGRAPCLVNLGLRLAAPGVVRIRGVAAVHVWPACGKRARRAAWRTAGGPRATAPGSARLPEPQHLYRRTHGGHEPRVDGVAVAADDRVLAVARAQRRGGHHACGRPPRSARVARRARERRVARQRRARLWPV